MDSYKADHGLNFYKYYSSLPELFAEKKMNQLADKDY